MVSFIIIHFVHILLSWKKYTQKYNEKQMCTVYCFHDECEEIKSITS